MSERLPRGFWQVGDDPGGRVFAKLDGDAGSGFSFEGGGFLPLVTVAYETWGVLDASKSNAVLVLHALTGDSHAAGPAGVGHVTPGWWSGVIGPGLAIDTDRYYVVSPNVLGGCQGTTGPASAGPDGHSLGSRFPSLTIRDQVAVEVALADHLGVDVWAGVVGGSMGAMRVLEWCVGYPNKVERAVVLAVGAAATAEQIAHCSLQIRAIKTDPAFAGGDYYEGSQHPAAGLALARGLGQITYRTASEFESRFGRASQDGEDPITGGRYAVESYLEHHGHKLVDRFDPNSYIVLSEAMNHHDIGRGRGGIETALSGVKAEVAVGGVVSDRLYPLELQAQIVDFLPRRSKLKVIESEVGHDGFLVEVDQVGDLIAGLLS